MEGLAEMNKFMGSIEDMSERIDHQIWVDGKRRYIKAEDVKAFKDEMRRRRGSES